jgi:hypothetical protein
MKHALDGKICPICKKKIKDKGLWICCGCNS